jgi:hypothetical protein
MLVSYKGAQPQKLPVNLADKTEAELNALGFEVCPDKPTLSPGQVLLWEGGQWVVRGPNEAETALARERVKVAIIELLFASDYVTIKAYEQGVPVDPEWITYRGTLRGIHNTIDSLDPFSVELPTRPRTAGTVETPETEE